MAIVLSKLVKISSFLSVKSLASVSLLSYLLLPRVWIPSLSLKIDLESKLPPAVT